MTEDIKRPRNLNFRQVLRQLDRGIGEEGNAWPGEAVTENEFSKVVDIRGYKHVGILGALQHFEAHSADIEIFVAQEIEQFYYAPGLSGQVSFEPKPDVSSWSSTVNYTIGDMVEHTVNGEVNIYTCIKNNSDKEPPDEEFWDLTFEDTEGEVIEFFRVEDIVPARYIQLQLVNSPLDYLKATIVAKF